MYFFSNFSLDSKNICCQSQGMQHAYPSFLPGYAMTYTHAQTFRFIMLFTGNAQNVNGQNVNDPKCQRVQNVNDPKLDEVRSGKVSLVVVDILDR